MTAGPWLQRPAATPNFWRGGRGVRGVWRAVLFAVPVAAGVYLLNILTALFAPPAILAALGSDVLTPQSLAGSELLLLLPLLGVTWVLAAGEGKRLADYGLIGPRGLVLGAQGLGWGILPPSLLVLVLALTGQDILHWGGLGPAQILGYGLAWLGASLVVGFAEEFCFRGYFFTCLARPYGPLIATLVSTALFAAAHLNNNGESLIGIGDIIFGGLLFALALVRTGSLWWSIGFHTGWDYAENFLLGTPDSGQFCFGTLLHTTALGPAWISGGATGPEGSLINLGLDIATLILAWFWLPRPRAAECA